MEKGGIDVYIISYSKRLYFVVCIFTIKRAKEKRRSKMVGRVVLDAIIVILSILLIIYSFRLKRNFDFCYDDREEDGIASMGLCCGVLDPDGNASMMCMECPHYTPTNRNGTQT